MKLGKGARKHDARTLKVEHYLAHEQLPSPPRQVRLSEKVPGWSMLMNDRIGDCVIVAALNLLKCDAANAGSSFEPTDEMALEAYRRIAGYNPEAGTEDDNPTDNGCVMLDVLNAWRHDGIGGEKIVAFAAVNPHNAREIEIALNLFGGLFAGFALPSVAQRQTVWTPARGASGDPGSWGGHGVYVPDYNDMPARSHDRMGCITWGARKELTYPFRERYMDECYVVITPRWLNALGESPGHLKLEDLLADVGKFSPVGQGQRQDAAVGQDAHAPEAGAPAPRRKREKAESE
jgi:hypothetical protein